LIRNDAENISTRGGKERKGKEREEKLQETRGLGVRLGFGK
jgi:hypothetical protein